MTPHIIEDIKEDKWGFDPDFADKRFLIMDSISALTSFVRTAETLSFVQAAQLLGISASAVGKNVARLEQQLGVRLFNRSTRSVSLTVEGALLLARTRPILEQLRDVEAEMTQTVAHPNGKLHVSLPVVGYRLITPLLPQFSQLYPDVELDLILVIGWSMSSMKVLTSRFAAARCRIHVYRRERWGLFVLCCAPAQPILPRTAGQHQVQILSITTVSFSAFPPRD